MVFRSTRNRLRNKFCATRGLLNSIGGNVLVYIIVVMLIFAVLGVAMVSLFSTSISSSATANESRRAFYLSESGLRYGMSELRNRGFSDSVIDPLNQTLFNLPPSGAFDLNVLSYWFKSASDQNILGSGSGTITVNLPKGEIPQGIWPGTLGNLFLVHCNYIDQSNSRSDQNPQDSARALVTRFDIDPVNRRSFDIQLSDDVSQGFVADKNTELCFAVKPASNQLILPFTNLRVDVAAKDIFPKTDGAIEVNRRPLFYRSAVDKGSYVELTDITFANWDPLYAAPLEQVWQASDYVMLSPRNYVVLSQGQSSNVTFGGDMAHSISVARQTAGGNAPDIGPDNSDYSETSETRDFQQTESTPNFIQLNETEKTITIGGGNGNRLGSIFFRDTRNIGGNRNFCSDGKCLFNSGIRVFFTLEYTGSGDGLIFSLINGASNSTSSIGGDIGDSSGISGAELLGYSGDGRLNVGGTLYIAGSAKNLNLPKIGLEFDTKVNFSDEFERTVNYCSGSNLKENTRNDPGSTGRDAIQYVFWGNSALDILCRGNNSSYDDNRHDATGPGPGTEDWKKPTGNSINTSPALSPDSNTVYIGSGNNLIAYDAASGETKWSYSTGGRISSSPTVAYLGPEIGTIYLGSQDGYLYAITDTGLNAGLRWRYPTNTEGKNFGVVNTKPVVGEGGAIYFASNNQQSGFNVNYFFGLKPDKSQKWTALPNPRGPNNTYALSPVLSLTGAYVYLATTSGTIFRINTSTGDFNNFVSIPSNINFSPPAPLNENVFSPSIGSDGTIYVGAGNQIYAITPSGSASPFQAGSNPISSSPTAGPDGLVYVGNYDRSLYAVDTKGLGRGWSYPTGLDINSQPAVDANGHIYFGSNDNYVYALYSDGRLKWKYLTGGDVRGRPEVRANGSVYVGSFDYYFYAINQFANPKNFKNLRITSTSSTTVAGFDENNAVREQLSVALGSENDWLKGASSKGPWAVRMEVDRKLTATNSYYEYTLRTWLRQCGDSNCANIYGTFFEDTRVDYPIAIRPPLMEQTIRLSSDEHNDFGRFLFGFTSATNALDTQSATIRDFQLSFKRDNDPTATKNPAVDPDPNLP
jgi:outer membrane protein assembly factor BamB